MSSKTTTTDTTNQYNAAGMNNYNSFQSTLGNMMTQYANNPLGSSFFNQQAGMASANAANIGQRNISNVTSNARTGGGLLGNSGSFMQGSINNANLQNSQNQSTAWNGALNSALSNQKWALGSMEAYNPLQTGQNSTQTVTPGLGSYLGAAAGVGLNMAAPGLGSMMGGASFSDGYS